MKKVALVSTEDAFKNKAVPAIKCHVDFMGDFAYSYVNNMPELKRLRRECQELEVKLKIIEQLESFFI